MNCSSCGKKQRSLCRKCSGIEELKLEIGKLRAALEQARELLELCDPSGKRAEHIHAPEDEFIRNLCERVGYGAVMDSASRQWRSRDELGALGAHTCGPSVSSVRLGLKRINEALEDQP